MKRFLSLCALMAMMPLAALLNSCKDEPDVVEPDAAVTPNVTVAFNNTSFLPGDVLTITLTEDSGAEDRDAIPLYFSVTDTQTGLSADNLFTDFTYTATLAATASQISVNYTVIDEIDETYSLNFVVEADGCTVSGGSKIISVGTAYAVTLAVTGSDEGTVTEGDTFTISASTPVAPDSDLTISLSFESGAANYFSPIPETVVIPAGQTEGQTAEITATADGGDYQSDVSFEVTGESGSAHYTVLNSITVTRKDRDGYLYDETFVYPDPSQTFVSSTLEAKYNEYGNNGNYVVMAKGTDGSGSSHPNPELAAAGWTLENAHEFSYIPQGLYYPCFPANDYGNSYISYQNGWAEESTESMQTNCYMSYEKFTNVTQDGYVRIWSAFDEGSTTISGNETGDMRAIGTEVCKAMEAKSFPQAWAIFREGSRIEIRARMRGKLQGYSCFMRLICTSGTAPSNGQISILENPHYLDADNAFVQQRAVYGDYENDMGMIQNSDSLYIDTSDWNIYWAEITDDSTVKVGINGYTTVTLNKSDGSDFAKSLWPFNKNKNANGFYLLIGPKPADSVLSDSGYSDDQLVAGDWADQSLKNISYEESRTSDDSPRMEIDWVRVWRNENHTAGEANYYNNCWYY
ncbi:MAG: DUF5006 domain-containing protein [Bacteroidales bacterium]|nr:DUF5006 domain-containing protein [Bacteroidales bacterium]